MTQLCHSHGSGNLSTQRLVHEYSSCVCTSSKPGNTPDAHQRMSELWRSCTVEYSSVAGRGCMHTTAWRDARSPEALHAHTVHACLCARVCACSRGTPTGRCSLSIFWVQVSSNLCSWKISNEPFLMKKLVLVLLTAVGMLKVQDPKVEN